MPEICWPISPVAFAVCSASAFTSEATTAKPRPDSPARAASMVAFKASRLVCPAIVLISSTTSPLADLIGAAKSRQHHREIAGCKIDHGGPHCGQWFGNRSADKKSCSEHDECNQQDSDLHLPLNIVAHRYVRPLRFGSEVVDRLRHRLDD